MIPPDYYDVLARIESSGRLYAKAPSTSASGLFQFTRATWTAMGGAWGSDPEKAFGGLFPSAQVQTEMARRFTQANANGLRAAGVPINAATLYAAHFLGLTVAKRVLAAGSAAQLDRVVSAAVIKANPFLEDMSVGDFGAWLSRKTGLRAAERAASGPVRA